MIMIFYMAGVFFAMMAGGLGGMIIAILIVEGNAAMKREIRYIGGGAAMFTILTIVSMGACISLGGIDSV